MRPAILLPLGSKVLRPEDLAYLGLALPTRPVFLVKFHKGHGRFDRFLLRFEFKLRISADDLLRLSEGAIDYCNFST
jgi:hypothetical protein